MISKRTGKIKIGNLSFDFAPAVNKKLNSTVTENNYVEVATFATDIFQFVYKRFFVAGF